MNYALFIAGLAFLGAPPLAVASNVSNVSVQTTHSTAVLSFQVPAPAAVLVRYGVDPSVDMKTPIYTPGSGGHFTRPITGLQPGTKYYFSVLIGAPNTQPSQVWQCVPASGFSCASETIGTFQTPIGSHDGPLPTVSVNTIEPVVNGQRFIVKTDTRRACIDLQEQIQAG